MRALSATASATRRTIGAAVEAVLVLATVGALAFAAATAVGGTPGGATSVFAAKGGNGNGAGNTGSASVAAIVLDQSTDGLALGSRVTFTTTVVGLTGNEYALVYLKCVENGNTVYGQLDLPGTVFVLGGGSSPWWQVGGQASCVGYLQAYGSHAGLDTIRTLAQTPAFMAN